MFYDKFPEGTLHFQYKGVLEFNGETFIYGEAFAYPERDKVAYATGWAMEKVPAKGFGRGSEMQLLETSCWGRSIAALGIAVTRSIASREEVEKYVNPQNDPWQTPPDTDLSQNKGKISPETQCTYIITRARLRNRLFWVLQSGYRKANKLLA